MSTFATFTVQVWLRNYLLCSQSLALTIIVCYVQAGANPNINAGGATPLHVAADVGNLEVIRCLLNAGADPNASDDVLFSYPLSTTSF